MALSSPPPNLLLLLLLFLSTTVGAASNVVLTTPLQVVVNTGGSRPTEPTTPDTVPYRWARVGPGAARSIAYGMQANNYEYGNGNPPGWAVAFAVGGGNNLFMGSADGQPSGLSQIIRLTRYRTDIRNSGIVASFSAFLGGCGDVEGSSVKALVNFFTSSKKAAGSPIVLGPVNAADLVAPTGDAVTTLLNKTANDVLVPNATDFVQVFLSFNASCSAADNIFLTLKPAST